MALALADRVQETSTTTGTGTLTLAGAVIGYQSFAVVGNGNTTYYAITNAAGAWEVGIGTYTSAGTLLSRTTVLSSSNGGALVSFTGTLNVFVTYPSSKAVYGDGTTLVAPSGTILPVANGGTGASTAGAALTSLGAYPASNPNGYTNNTGTVTGVTGTAPVVSSGGTAPAISMAAATAAVNGYLTSTDWSTFNNKTSNTGTVTSVAMTVPTGLSIAGTPITTSGTLALTLTAGYSIPTTASQTTWDSAYTQRLQWDGGATNLVAATGRTSLGATTVGGNFFTLTNPTAITFPRINADNTVSALDAATFRTAIGAGTSSTSGTVTSVAATVPAFLSVAGSPITSSGTLAISYSGTALPVANGGTGLTVVGTSGNVLTSNGSAWVSSAPVGTNITTKGLYENAAIIAANYTIGTGNNAVSAGPITINSGIVVTVPSGSTWVVV